MAAQPYNYRQNSSRLGLTQSVAFTASSAAITNAFGPATYQIRIATTSSCYYQIGDGAQTASITTSPYLPSTWVEYVTVNPGQRISFIQQTAGGTATITEIL